MFEWIQKITEQTKLQWIAKNERTKCFFFRTNNECSKVTLQKMYVISTLSHMSVTTAPNSHPNLLDDVMFTMAFIATSATVVIDLKLRTMTALTAMKIASKYLNKSHRLSISCCSELEFGCSATKKEKFIFTKKNHHKNILSSK